MAMKRSIPPKTMRDVSRLQNRPSSLGLGAALHVQISTGVDPPQPVPAGEGIPAVRPFKARQAETGAAKTRDWQFQTKPKFKKIKGPLVDVFHEAEEVLVIIDLGGFARGDVTLQMQPDRYLICAERGGQKFSKEISLPAEVDTENCSENYRNGVLEIVLPRKKATGHNGAE